jgi:acyl carrier protein
MHAMCEEMGMNRSELIEKFRAMASEIAEQDFSHVTEEHAIADLGMDSLSMLELVGSMEREYTIHIPEEDLSGVQTVRQLLEVVERRRTSLVA